MSYTKCPQCSLVNMTADELCERCGAPLSVNAMNAAVEESAAPANLPDFTFGQDVTTGSKTVKVILVVFEFFANVGYERSQAAIL